MLKDQLQQRARKNETKGKKKKKKKKQSEREKQKSWGESQSIPHKPSQDPPTEDAAMGQIEGYTYCITADLF
jgi:hypothetical protein